MAKENGIKIDHNEMPMYKYIYLQQEEREIIKMLTEEHNFITKLSLVAIKQANRIRQEIIKQILYN